MERLIMNKKIIFSICSFLTIVILVMIWWFWTENISATLTINVAPSSSKISLNNRDISNGTHHINPGKYTLKVSKEEFESQEIEFEVKSKEKKDITLALSQLDGGTSWYLNNRNDDLIRSAAGSQKVIDEMSKLKENSPIAKHLPYKDVVNNRFSVDYELSNNSIKSLKVTINSCINTSSGIDSVDFRKQSAQFWINSVLLDSEKDKYKINYIIQDCVL